MTKTPHVLLFNTDLPAYAVQIEGVVCVNSGKFTRNNKVGTISKITIMDMDGEMHERIRVDDI